MLGIMPHKMFRGIKSLDGPHMDKHGDEFVPMAMDTMPLQEMASTKFDTDAHFVCYSVVGDDEYPRLNKSALRSIRSAGADVVSKYIVLDWDTPKAEGSKDKVPLNDELFQYFVDMIYGTDGELGNWCMAYTTANGGRLVYQLPIALPVDNMEDYIAGMIYSWKAQKDIEMDTACKDWTRLFRAPQVMRDGYDTSDAEFFFIDNREDKFLDVNRMVRLSSNVQTIEVEIEDTDLPDQHELEELLSSVNGTTNHRVQTAFYKVAKKNLRGSIAYGGLFDPSVDMFDGEERNNLIGRYLGITIPKLLRCFKGLTPQHVMALFYDQLTKLEPDEGTPCWIAHAWNFLLVIWEKEIVNLNNERMAEAAVVSETMSVMDRMVEGMKGWCDHEDLKSSNQDVRYAYLRAHVFVTFNKFFYSMGVEGEYETFPVTKEQLVSRIRRTHLNGVIETVEVNHTGQELDVSSTKLQNNHSTPVERIVQEPQLRVKGFVEDMNGEHPQLKIPMYRRNPNIEAEYSEEVHEWLMYLFGLDHESGMKWISNSLAFEDGPICALSIKGPGDIGKKLLTVGLEECMENPVSATGKDICGTFNAGLSRSPFLFINEAWPKNKGDMSPSDLFKSLTAGDTITINEKYKPTSEIINPMRIVFTANDHDLLYELTGGKDMSPESRKATGDRLLHFDVGPEAGHYIEKLGGREFTEKEGARWIRGDDGGSKSNHVVAKHFLWLYENRDEPNKRQRLLVMGNCGGCNHVMYDMMLQQPATATCIKAIVRMIQAKSNRSDTMHVEKESFNVFVTVMGLSEYIEEILDVKGMGIRSVELALKNIMKTELGKVENNKKWIEIDCQAVLQFAESMGMEADTLRGISFKQKEYELLKRGD